MPGLRPGPVDIWSTHGVERHLQPQRLTSRGLRPTLAPLTEAHWMVPAGSTIKGRVQRHALRPVEDTERRRELALDIGEHWDRQVAEIGIVQAPIQVGVLAVGRDAVHHCAALGELAGERTEGPISVGQTKVKSFGQKNTTFH